jgi:hypothetical protein
MIQMEKLPIVELKINDSDKKVNLEALSLVSEPAIQVNFVALGKDKPIITFNKFEAAKPGPKHMLYGPALIPNKLILRKDDDGNPFNVFFSEDTAEQCMHIFMSKSQELKTDHEKELSDAYVAENWMVRVPDCDTANFYGFNGKQLNRNTWFSGVKVNNDMVWDRVQAGELNGFSIEGFFVNQFFKYCLKKEIDDDTLCNLVYNITYSELPEEEKIKQIQTILNQ